MSGAIIGTRSFSAGDVQVFANLSGDLNPIHIDPVAARRSMFGGAVVHGLAMLCFALDRALTARPRASKVALAKLTAVFSQPLYVGETVSVRSLGSGDELALALEVEGQQIASAKARLTDAFAARTVALEPPVLGRPVDLELEAMDAREGSVSVGFDPALLENLYPVLAARLQPVQTAELLASTRIVGMEVPGLRSLYGRLELEETNDPRNGFDYRVTQTDHRMNLVDIAVFGPSLSGSVRTFVRPKPEPQPTMERVENIVRPDEFEGMRVLVVGGTRGLGEVSAKAIGAGGGEVVITYALGTADAERVVNELRSHRVRASAMRLDVTEAIDEDVLRAAFGDPPTHVLYFATPHVPMERRKSFSASRFETLARFYVTGFANVVKAVRKLGTGELAVLYPSTVFLDELPRGSEEYCAAKAAGEALARSLARNLPRLRIDAPRIPRVRTDQTLSILPVQAEDTLDVVLPRLRALRAPRSST